MSLRGNPLEQEVTLPDGRLVSIRIGVPEDSYIKRRDLDTVTIELRGDGEHLAAVSTLLRAKQSARARELLREVVTGLESGRLEPTAGALERLADRLH